MPVTANFSEAFYDRLGHDIVEELVAFLNRIDTSYKIELRELNDLNFQRFEAKVGQRFAEIESKIERRFAESDMKLERSMGELRSEMAQTESKLIRWMFVFWAGSTLTILGTMAALLKL